jgi:transcription initiation factor TFIIB
MRSSGCRYCKVGRLITDLESGEIICSNCGLVFSDKAEEARAEWRSFDSGINKSTRAGGTPFSLAQHDMGLSTFIAKDNKDSSGTRIDQNMLYSMNRLRTWDFRSRVRTSSDRDLLYAFDELRRLKDKLGLSDAVVEKTALIYRKAVEKRLLRGRSISVVLAASVYLACRELDAARTLNEIIEASNVKPKSVSRVYRLLITELDIKTPISDPMKCIARIANKAKVNEKTKRRAIDMMEELMKTEVHVGKAPMSFAASVLYVSCLVSDDWLSQKAIAEAAGITDITIRSRLKDIKRIAKEIKLE